MSDDVAVAPHSLPFDPTPETDKAFDRSRTYLKRRFAAWCKTNAPEVDGDIGETILHQKWSFMDQELTRWTCADLDEVFLHLHPAKVIIEPDELDSVLDEGRAFIAFMADAGWLDEASDEPEAMIAHLDEIDPDFRSRMTDESWFSPGKRFWTQAMAEGVSMDDQQGVDEFMDRYNARLTFEGPPPRRPSPFSPFMSGPPARNPPAPGARRSGPDLRLISGRATPPGTPPRQARRKGRKR